MSYLRGIHLLTSAGIVDRTTFGVTNPWVTPSTVAKAMMRIMAEGGVPARREKMESPSRDKGHECLKPRGTGGGGG